MNFRFKNLRKFFLAFSKNGEPFDYAVTDTNEAETIRYLGNHEEVKVPPNIDGNAIKAISPFTFTDRTDITSVVIPNGVEELD